MNRDEQRTRPAGLPPRWHFSPTGIAVHPSEPGGGTWISLNDHGVAFALLNGYDPCPEPNPSSPPRLSRGEVVRRLRSVNRSTELPGQLARLPLPRMRRFRLIAVLPAEYRLLEGWWDGHDLVSRWHAWRPCQWSSSGFDEPRARQARGQVFQHRSRDPRAGSLDWLRALHGSHEPETGPFSTCMHRPDAVTVSYTEIEVDPNVARLRYLPCAPCGQGVLTGDGTPDQRSTRSPGEACRIGNHGAPPDCRKQPSAIPAPAGPDGSRLILGEYVLDRL